MKAIRFRPVPAATLYSRQASPSPSSSRWSIPRVLVGSFGFDGKTPKVNTRSPGLTSTFSRSDRSPQRAPRGGSRPISYSSRIRARSLSAKSLPRPSSRTASRSPSPAARDSSSRSRTEWSKGMSCGRSLRADTAAAEAPDRSAVPLPDPVVGSSSEEVAGVGREADRAFPGSKVRLISHAVASRYCSRSSRSDQESASPERLTIAPTNPAVSAMS
jgi:hypothetical protein